MKEQQLVAQWLDSDEGYQWSLSHFVCPRHHDWIELVEDNEEEWRYFPCDADCTHGTSHSPGHVDIYLDLESFVVCFVIGPHEKWMVW